MIRSLLGSAGRWVATILALLLGLITPIHASGSVRSCADDITLPSFVDDLTPPTSTFLAAYRANGPPDGTLIIVPLDTAMEAQVGPLRRLFVRRLCIRGWSAGGGNSLYGGYFVPNGVDPTGLLLFSFDGTGNYSDDMYSVDRGGGTNVRKMTDSYLGKAFYFGGIGNSYENGGWISWLQGGTGLGGSSIERRALDALLREINNPSGDDRNIDIVGFSRGAALALDFLHVVKKSINEKSKCQSEFKIRFVGLFDAVGSFRIPGNSVNLGKDLHLPDGLFDRPYYVAHAVALDETREMFSVIDVVGANEQRTFRGAHSDIGGGYANHGLSDIALMWMVNQGQRAGAPFSNLSGLSPDPTMPPHRELSLMYKHAPRQFPAGMTNPLGLKPIEMIRDERYYIGPKGGDVRRFQIPVLKPWTFVNPFYSPDSFYCLEVPYGE